MSGRAKAIASITASAFGFALMAMFVRLCDDCGAPVSSFQKSFFRNAIALIVAATVFCRGTVARERRVPSLSPKAAAVLALRSLAGKTPATCVGCRSCEAVCPQNIKISEMMADFASKIRYRGRADYIRAFHLCPVINLEK